MYLYSVIIFIATQIVFTYSSLPIGEEAEISCMYQTGIDEDLSHNVSFAIPPPVPSEFLYYLQCLYEKNEFIIDDSLESYYMTVNAQVLGLIDRELAVVINDCETTSRNPSISQMIFDFDSCVGRGILPYFGYGTPLDEIAKECAKSTEIDEDDAVLPCVSMVDQPTIRMMKYWECKYEKRGFLKEGGSIDFDKLKQDLLKKFTQRGADLIVDTCHHDWSSVAGENIVRVEKCIGTRVINMVMHSVEILQNMYD